MQKRLELVRHWFLKAENDLKTVRLLLQDSAPPGDVVCFHAQQAAEKYLKGYLFYQQKEFPKIHNLESLIEICKESDADFQALMDPAADLTGYSVEIRYPDRLEIPSAQEMSQAQQNALAIKEEVLRRLPDELRSEFQQLI